MDQGCDADLLADVPLFAELTRAERKRVAAVAKPANFREGDCVVDEGSQGGRFFVIQSGTAKVQVNGRTRATLGAGSYFGELSVLDGGQRTASVVAAGLLETWSIAEFNFRALLKQHPTLALKLLNVLSGRLRDAERSLLS